MNVTYLQRVYISSRKCCNEYAMFPCMLAYLHVSLGCRSLSVLFVVFNNPARYLYVIMC